MTADGRDPAATAAGSEIQIRLVDVTKTFLAASATPRVVPPAARVAPQLPR